MKIEFVNSEIIDYKDFNMPKLLFKYRDWGDAFHRRMISNQEVYFASPAKFEDSFDCRNPTRWDLLTKEEILNKYYQDSIKIHPNFTPEERMIFAIDWANHTKVTDKAYVEKMQQETFNQFNERAGVLSLTEYPLEERMWMKYAKSHTGFCVGFDAKIMLNGIGGGGGPVLYHDELPEIHPTPKHSFAEQNILQIFNKLNKWSFEKEYRIHMFKAIPLTQQDRRLSITPNAFKEIILGYKMTKENQQRLLESIPKELNHISIKKIVFENNTLSIKTLKN